jgi:hypothetical protein
MIRGHLNYTAISTTLTDTTRSSPGAMDSPNRVGLPQGIGSCSVNSLPQRCGEV